MRVLILLRGFDSLKKHEVGNFELDQAKALAALGHDVRAIAADVRSPLHPRRAGCYEYTADGIPVIYSSIPCGMLIPSLQERMSTRALSTALKALARTGWEPDVVHAHFLSKGYSFCTVPESDRYPFVITEHSSFLNNEEIPENLQKKMRIAYKKARRVIAVGSGLRDNIYKYTGVEARVIPNMVDVSVFTPPDRRQRGETFRFASAGNLYRRKGFDILLDAMALLRARGESVSLTLMGGGEEEAALKKQAQTLGLTDCVRFTGGLSREEIAAVCRESDAFALASRRETFGVVYIEAMATGLPVIATRCMGPEDFVNDENGILVPPEDAAAFADAMERMIRSRDRYDSEAIAAFVRSRFSPQNVAEQLTQVYKEIVKC